MQIPLPAASPALFGHRLFLRATLVTDSAPDLEVLDLTAERETTVDERAYAVRLQVFIAASAATLQGASA